MAKRGAKVVAVVVPGIGVIARCEGNGIPFVAFMPMLAIAAGEAGERDQVDCEQVTKPFHTTKVTEWDIK